MRELFTSESLFYFSCVTHTQKDKKKSLEINYGRSFVELFYVLDVTKGLQLRKYEYPWDSGNLGCFDEITYVVIKVKCYKSLAVSC